MLKNKKKLILTFFAFAFLSSPLCANFKSKFAKSFIYASYASIIDFSLLSLKSSYDHNTVMHKIPERVHASTFTALSVLNLSAPSQMAKPMGFVFLPFAVFGHYLCLKESKHLDKSDASK